MRLSWDHDDVAVPFTNVSSDTLTGYVLGVDDDSDFDTTPWWGPGGDLSDWKDLGEWAEQTFVEDLGPIEYTVDGENWEKQNTVWAHVGYGSEVSFTWQYEISVSYS